MTCKATCVGTWKQYQKRSDAYLKTPSVQLMIQTHLSYRIDRWDTNGNLLDHVADIDDLRVAVAAYEAACERWPGASLTLRQGARVIADSRRTRLA